MFSFFDFSVRRLRLKLFQLPSDRVRPAADGKAVPAGLEEPPSGDAGAPPSDDADASQDAPSSTDDAPTEDTAAETDQARQRARAARRAYLRAQFLRAEKARQQAEQDRRWAVYRQKLADERAERDAGEHAERDAGEHAEQQRKAEQQARTRKQHAKTHAQAKQQTEDESSGAGPSGEEPPGYEEPGTSDDGFDYKRATRAERDAHYGRVLDLSGEVTIRGIKARYRALAAQYHPDKVEHLGEKLRATARRETRRLNEAYTYFRRRHDF